MRNKIKIDYDLINEELKRLKDDYWHIKKHNDFLYTLSNIAAKVSVPLVLFPFMFLKFDLKAEGIKEDFKEFTSKLPYFKKVMSMFKMSCKKDRVVVLKPGFYTHFFNDGKDSYTYPFSFTPYGAYLDWYDHTKKIDSVDMAKTVDYYKNKIQPDGSFLKVSKFVSVRTLLKHLSNSDIISHTQRSTVFNCSYDDTTFDLKFIVNKEYIMLIVKPIQDTSLAQVFLLAASDYVTYPSYTYKKGYSRWKCHQLQRYFDSSLSNLFFVPSIKSFYTRFQKDKNINKM